MMNGEEMSVRSALINYGIGRFQARAGEIRKIYPIADRWETYHNQWGQTVRYKVYFMENPNG